MVNDISIIIPVFKAKNTIKLAIDSILSQKYNDKKPKIEIIICIDDQDRYENIVNKKNQDIKINLISTKKIGSGPGNARNHGILKSSGKYICFLDADDKYSNNYVEEMYKHVVKHDIVTSPTHVYKNNKKLIEFRGIKKNLLVLEDIAQTPCSFHPFLKRDLVLKFESMPSQDIYNMALLLNKKLIKMINGCYYQLNIRKDSYTSKNVFYHKVEKAYKYYQIKSITENNIKIAQQFALRRIINKKYIKWSKLNFKKTYYEYLKGMKND